MNHIFITLVIFYCYTAKVENVKDEFLLENMTHCDQPQPPFSHKKRVVLDFKVNKPKGKHLLSGHYTVLAEVPFRNFSLSGYNIDDNGKKERWFYVEKISCRNFFGRSFLAFGSFQYNKDDCILQRGSVTFKDLDLDRFFHQLPVQQAKGRLLYRTQLVADGCTVFCVETRFYNKAVK